MADARTFTLPRLFNTAVQHIGAVLYGLCSTECRPSQPHVLRVAGGSTPRLGAPPARIGLDFMHTRVLCVHGCCLHVGSNVSTHLQHARLLVAVDAPEVLPHSRMLRGRGQGEGGGGCREAERDGLELTLLRAADRQAVAQWQQRRPQLVVLLCQLVAVSGGASMLPRGAASLD